MSRTEGAADRLLHPTLSPAAGAELAAAHCTDRAKLGVVLQGAGLLSLCDAAGWSLADGWSGARVDSAGRLNGLAVRPGRDRSAVQPRLSDLLLRLFRARGRVAGRGEARRAARLLTELWESQMVPMSSDDAIAILFESAPFLWDADLAPSRDALRGAFERAGGRTDWVAGPPVVRRRLEGDALPCGATAAELAERGRWSDAVRLWRDSPPANATEQLALAEALYSIGRFDAALLILAERDDGAGIALRAGCRFLLGELGAARELVERLRVRPLLLSELLDAGDLALRVFALAGDVEAQRDWTGRALAAAKSPADRSRAHLLAATAAMDEGDLAKAERNIALAASAVSSGEAEGDWRWHEVRGWLAQARGDGAAMVEHARALLRLRRRRMRRFEAGRAWNNLGLGHLLRGELAAAERAFEQSARLLRRCDGPLAVTLPLSNLAEARLRAGKIVEVEPILRASMSHNRRSGNARGLQLDEALWIRLELVRGAPEVALERAERLERTVARRPAAERPPFALLAARAAGWLERPEDAARWLARAGAEEATELDAEELPGLHALAGDLERARRFAADGPFAALWNTILQGETPGAPALRAFEALEPYRRARLALDIELLAPGSLPAAAREAAAARFRRIGARRYAALFEREAGGLWAALRSYLERSPDDPSAADAGELLRAAGHPEATLLLRDGDSEALLAKGEGEAAEEISAAVDGGTLLLRAARIDEPLRALFALLRRDAEGRRRGPLATLERESALHGRSPSLLAAIDRLRQFAPSTMPVLILGESGTGKELAAKEIRRGSARAAGPWVAVNCAALSETLLLSDLFGHARGAFTGADRPHAGVFETAHGGTVFLDEIGDLSPVAQGNLLRVLQEGEVRRLGESLPRKVDVRLVAATHRDLGALAREGKFRQDLYYRLKVCTVTLPPLRARGADVELLAEEFLETERRELGRPLLRLTAETRRRLAAHAWPGNVRELQHVVRAAAALAGDGPVGPELLDLETGTGELPVGDYHRDVYEFRRGLVARALAEAKGNRAAAARRLGLSRQALSYLVRELDLEGEVSDRRA